MVVKDKKMYKEQAVVEQEVIELIFQDLHQEVFLYLLVHIQYQLVEVEQEDQIHQAHQVLQLDKEVLVQKQFLHV